MPTQKRRRRDNRRKRERAKQRKKLLALTPDEEASISEVRRNQAEYEKGWVSSPRTRGEDRRNLQMADEEHRRAAPGGTRTGDLLDDLRMLSNRFPNQTIRVYDDGTGHSTYAQDLAEKAKEEGIKVEVVKSDIRPDMKGVDDTVAEELVKRYGRESFHMVLSTYGGIMYTRGNQRKALANIVEVMKPGGMASIVSSDSPRFTGGKRLHREMIKKVVKSRGDIMASEITWDRKPPKPKGPATRLVLRKLYD